MGGSLRGCVDVVVFIVFILERGGQGRSKGSVGWRSHRGGVGAGAGAGEGGGGAQTTGEQLEQLRSPFEAWLALARSIACWAQPNAQRRRALRHGQDTPLLDPNVWPCILCLGMRIVQEGLWCSGITPLSMREVQGSIPCESMR